MQQLLKGIKLKLPARKSKYQAIKKMPTGIEGFDEISLGGLPCGRTTLVMGGPGCGKTVFALQLLVNGAMQSREAGIFVAFEEGTRQVVANAAAFGWNLPLLEKKKLFFLDAQLSPTDVKAGEFDLIGMLSLLENRAKAMGATRIVFDGIDVLLSLLDDPVAERREMYRIRDWLLQSGLTGIITQKAGSASLADQRYSFMQFMVDCVVVLQHQVVDGSDFRNLRIVKYRGSNFDGDEFPITITAQGLKLAALPPRELTYLVTEERISSGIDRLDHMLRGGYYRGSHVLVSGMPGTAKSTLAGLFAAAACARGERVLFISFDESAAQIVRNFRSIDVQFAPYVKSGLLNMYSLRTRGPKIDDQIADLRAKVLDFRPQCLVIDPFSALAKVTPSVANDSGQQFLDFLKGAGITVLNTSLLMGLDNQEATATGVSTMADTWIHLSYVVLDGERNRALTIVKSRGTGHSNQVRELILNDKGVTLADVFIAQGKVLMGTARWEWEQQQLAARALAHNTADYKKLQLELAQAEGAVRIQAIKTEMEIRTAEIALLADATGSATELRKSNKVMRQKLRQADIVALPPLSKLRKTGVAVTTARNAGR
ncbi:MAG: circadian clock protein KaiC [Pseudohongiellaceae bacterium]